MLGQIQTSKTGGQLYSDTSPDWSKSIFSRLTSLTESELDK